MAEASVGCLITPSAPARIHQLIPDVRYIAVLRHPVGMAYFNFNRLQVLATPGRLEARTKFAEKIKHRPRFLESGRYAKLHRSYFKYFDRENVVVMLFDDMVRSNEGFLREVYRHIGVDESFISQLLNKKVGSSEILRSSSVSMPLYYLY